LETLLHLFFLASGGLLLYFGAEWMVMGAAGLAVRFGVTPLVVGLTVVAYGTSAPELAVSAVGQWQGQNEFVIGTVVGSCITNLGLILGLTALIKPPHVSSSLIRREIPILVLTSLAVPLVLWNNVVELWEAILLLGASVAFTVMVLVGAKNRPAEVDDSDVAETPDWKKRTLLAVTLVGIAVLTGGGKLFVMGALGVAATLGLSEGAVGFTIVALGTSLPELAASVVAALRGFSGIAVGNVVGSNIFNVLLVLGAVGCIGEIPGVLFPAENGDGGLLIEIGFLVGITIIGALAMRGKKQVSRPEGIALLTIYVVFIAVVIQQAL